ncbi:hypothetical protein Csa_010421 [Cucumis sativus]|nr:hypothetical protein Csa_010421 [Cucumis sativus]
MIMSKRMTLVFIGILLVSFDMIMITNAKKFIDYGSIVAGDVSPGCSPTHPELCRVKSANPYQRGCNRIDRCREGNDIIDAEEEHIEGDASISPSISPNIEN